MCVLVLEADSFVFRLVYFSLQVCVFEHEAELFRYQGLGYLSLAYMCVTLSRTILLFHIIQQMKGIIIISVRPFKQPLMVRTFLKVYTELGSYFCFCKNK